ncbi:hypothetical protein ABH942_000791 [Flavobacterium sp. 28YEA47A]|uniref:hypothetical protein n=1 Tax=Flavobacterium sp. 28YEA47A TaxID=3156276 RepID=UPI00351509E2
MKTKIIAGSLLAVSLFMTSCKKELQPQESSEPTEAVATDPAAAPAEGQMPVNAQPQQVQAQPQVNVQPQPVATAPGMNPPHGQPGHRCDIAVGAPLNSPPGQNPATAQPTQPAPQPTAAPSTITPVNNADIVTAPGMNPPHGQPGHRCDIAVGQPLPKA